MSRRDNPKQRTMAGPEGRQTTRGRLKTVIETGRRRDRWLERVVGTLPEKQTDNQRGRDCQPVREEQTGKADRHHNRSKQVERQAATRMGEEKSRGQQGERKGQAERGGAGHEGE